MYGSSISVYTSLIASEIPGHAAVTQIVLYAEHFPGISSSFSTRYKRQLDQLLDVDSDGLSAHVDVRLQIPATDQPQCSSSFPCHRFLS